MFAPFLAAVGFKAFKKPASPQYNFTEDGFTRTQSVKTPSRIHVVHTIDDRFYVWCHDGVYELHPDLTFHLVAPKIVPPPIAERDASEDEDPGWTLPMLRQQPIERVVNCESIQVVFTRFQGTFLVTLNGEVIDVTENRQFLSAIERYEYFTKLRDELTEEIQIKRIPDPYPVSGVEIARRAAELDLGFGFTVNMERATARQSRLMKEVYESCKEELG